MKKAHYTAIAAITAMSAVAILTGATHHIIMLGICSVLGLAAWGTRDDDDGIVEFEE
jgi:hypothetical protein